MSTPIVTTYVLSIKPRPNLHAVWSRVQAAFAAVGATPETRRVELTLAQEVTGPQLDACIAPRVAGDEDGGRAAEVPANRRTEVLATSIPAVADAAVCFGEPSRAGFYVDRPFGEPNLPEDPRAVLWVWRLQEPELAEAYRIARDCERDVMPAHHRSRAVFEARQHGDLPGGGWLRLRTTLSPTFCRVFIDFEVHIDSVKSETFVTFWRALQGVFGKLDTDAIRRATLVDSEHVDPAPVFVPSALKTAKRTFRVPKDPRKKPPPKRKRNFLCLKEGFSLPRGLSPKPRLDMLAHIVKVLGVKPDGLQLSAYDVADQPLHDLLIEHCLEKPTEYLVSPKGRALQAGVRQQWLGETGHSHSKEVTAVLAALGEPDQAGWRKARRSGPLARWEWHRPDHADLHAWCTLLAELGEDGARSVRIAARFHAKEPITHETIEVRAVLTGDTGIAHVEVPVYAKVGSPAFHAVADRLEPVLGFRVDAFPNRSGWRKCRRGLDMLLDSKEIWS